jgi:molecular chaperone GrpE
MYQRAETQTMARRVEDERRKASEFAISKFAQSLLDTTDTFAVALKHVPKPVEPNTPLASLVQGVELTQKALLKTFEQNKVLKMDIKQGDGFDPNLHEATFQLPKEVAPPKKDGGAWESGQVVEVTKEGWMIGQRVLRPAQVGVTQIE